MSVRSTLLALVLVLAACGKADRQDQPGTRSPSTASAQRGPDNLVLRIPRTGGTARVYAYPRLDTVVWSSTSAPAPAQVLGFDEEAGEIAYVDVRGYPARVDFRQGGAGTVSKAKLTAITSSDGSTIYAIGPDGAVQRYAESGTWKWKPPRAARAVFPQPDGSLLVLGERRDGAVLWRLHPPSTDIVDSVVLPKVDRTLRTQVGDRLYLGAQRELTGVRTRTMERTPTLKLEAPIELLAATPSGDRVFVVTKGSTAIDIVDRYRERLNGSIDVARNISDLRMDPLGRYLLARPDRSDSAIVVALGTNQIIGVVATTWRADLPFVAPDGGIALAQGADVMIVTGDGLKPTTRVRSGATDYWYPFRWTGFRPRDASLDQPVQFAAPPDSTHAVPDSLALHIDSSAAAARDSTPRRATGFTVSFAAYLNADQARELAAQVHVGSENARVITAVRDSSTIYRVVLGPYPTRDEAERVGRESKQKYWVYEGGP